MLTAPLIGIDLVLLDIAGLSVTFQMAMAIAVMIMGGYSVMGSVLLHAIMLG